MMYSYTILATLFGASLAVPTQLDSYRVFESIDTLSQGWEVNSQTAVDPSAPIQLKIHLTQQNVANFEQKVLDLSTPNHPSYGQHLSTNQIKEMLQPSDNTVELVSKWLSDAGVHAKFDHDWVYVDTTVSQAEQLLQAKYQTFKDAVTGSTSIRTLSYSLPASLHAHVNTIHPTTLLGRTSAMKTTINHINHLPKAAQRQGFISDDVHDGLNVTACNAAITPDCLAALYKFKHFRASRRNGNVMAVAGFLEEYAQENDFEQFLATYKKTAAGFGFTCQPVNGGLCTQNSTSDFGEANLDIQYAVGLTYPTPNIYYSTAGRPPALGGVQDNEPYLEYLQYLLAQPTLPATISHSYGDHEDSIPPSYARTVCNLFAQLGARGVSVLFSSGDSGPGGTCINNKNETAFVPVFPSSCPWVTSVGGTIGVSPEKAVGFSSGGFSNYFERPSWQSVAVDSFLETDAAKKWTPYFNASGRAFPDVSAQGENYHVIISGQDLLIGGTSASSPTFASVISLVNSDRLSRGQPPLGFLNPWLYTEALMGGGLTDITNGTSVGCQQQIQPFAGWEAVEGYDPVTGLGTPNFKGLVAVSRKTVSTRGR